MVEVYQSTKRKNISLRINLLGFHTLSDKHYAQDIILIGSLTRNLLSKV